VCCAGLDRLRSTPVRLFYRAVDPLAEVFSIAPESPARAANCVPMTKLEMQTILAGHLARFRAWPYAELAKRLEQKEDCLERMEATAPDGTTYQLEVELFWDHEPNGDIRVFAQFWANPQRQLLGFLPIYFAHATDSFIMHRDGTFVGEDRK
jgi:hypothetical protein